MKRICVTPRVEGLAGMASFRIKLEESLRARGVDVTYDLAAPSDAILVLAGTRKLIPLWEATRRGRRVAQRLDGINWVHRKRNTGVKHYLRAEYGNFILSFIRKRIASKIIYQSRFSKNWWEDWYGAANAPSVVIHNGVDLKTYSVGKDAVPSYPPYKILVVEGSLGGGYDMGLDNAIALTETLAAKHNLSVELIVVGKISEAHKNEVQSRARIPITWLGTAPREKIPELDRSAHLFFSADLHPACPNSVIEALACGLPVLAYDTGAMNELVIGDAGRLVPYGSDPWKIEKPDIPSLAEAAVEILNNQPHFRDAARAHAEAALSLEVMADAYIKALLE